METPPTNIDSAISMFTLHYYSQFGCTIAKLNKSLQVAPVSVGTYPSKGTLCLSSALVQGCCPWGCRGCHGTPGFWLISLPYLNQGGRLCLLNNTWHPGFSDLPTALIRGRGRLCLSLKLVTTTKTFDSNNVKVNLSLQIYFLCPLKSKLPEICIWTI